MAKAKFIKEIKGESTPTKNIRGALIQLFKSKNPMVITELKDAKILISKIVYDLQINKIEEKRAKTILYALTVYIQACKDIEFEERLKDLEKKLSGSIAGLQLSNGL